MTEINKHTFQSAKADGGDASLVRPSDWNAEHRIGSLLTNKSGGLRLAGDVVVVDSANDEAFTTTTVQGSHKTIAVVMESIANNAVGLTRKHGVVTVATQGAVTRGNFLRASTTAARAEDAGVYESDGAFAVALTAAGAGPNTVQALLLGRSHRSAAPGTMKVWPSASTPVGWLLCDGTAVSRTTFADLFAEIGTTWGVGDGSTTFNLPDMRDRVLLGVSGTKALGSSGGSETINLQHNHTLAGGARSDILDSGSYVWSEGGDLRIGNPDLSGTKTSVADLTDVALSTAQSVLPQYRAARWLIKT